MFTQAWHHIKLCRQGNHVVFSYIKVFHPLLGSCIKFPRVKLEALGSECTRNIAVVSKCHAIFLHGMIVLQLHVYLGQGNFVFCETQDGRVKVQRWGVIRFTSNLFRRISFALAPVIIRHVYLTTPCTHISRWSELPSALWLHLDYGSRYLSYPENAPDYDVH